MFFNKKDKKQDFPDKPLQFNPPQNNSEMQPPQNPLNMNYYTPQINNQSGLTGRPINEDMQQTQQFNTQNNQIPQPPVFKSKKEHDYFLSQLPLIEEKETSSSEDRLHRIDKAVDLINQRFAERNEQKNTIRAPTPPSNLTIPLHKSKIREIEDEFLKIKPTRDEIEEQEIEIDDKHHKKNHYVMVEDYKKVLEQINTIKIKVREFHEKTHNYEGFLERHKNEHEALLKKLEYMQRHIMLVDQTLYKGRGGI